MYPEGHTNKWAEDSGSTVQRVKINTRVIYNGQIVFVSETVYKCTPTLRNNDGRCSTGGERKRSAWRGYSRKLCERIGLGSREINRIRSISKVWMKGHGEIVCGVVYLAGCEITKSIGIATIKNTVVVAIVIKLSCNFAAGYGIQNTGKIQGRQGIIEDHT